MAVFDAVGVMSESSSESSSSSSQDINDVVSITGGKMVSTLRCKSLLLDLFFDINMELNRLLTFEKVEYFCELLLFTATVVEDLLLETLLLVL
jgi:hypothetical protein